LFDDFVDHIYPIEIEINKGNNKITELRKDTTDNDRSASYLDLHLEFDSEAYAIRKTFEVMTSTKPIGTLG
jgi:molybdopterin-binding protein